MAPSHRWEPDAVMPLVHDRVLQLPKAGTCGGNYDKTGQPRSCLDRNTDGPKLTTTAIDQFLPR
jgi:hypothetical protein